MDVTRPPVLRGQPERRAGSARVAREAYVRAGLLKLRRAADRQRPPTFGTPPSGRQR